MEKPVLVFFCGVRPSLSNRTARSCGVELTLNSSPASAQISSVQRRRTRRPARSLRRAQLGLVDPDARRPPCGPAPAPAAPRCRRAARAGPGRRARRAGRPDQRGRRPGPAAGRRSTSATAVAAEVELALGRAVAVGQAPVRRSGRAGRRAGSGSRPGRAGTRRAPCRAAGCARRGRGSSSVRISGLASCAASGRPPSATSAAERARAPADRSSDRPGSHTTSPMAASATSASPSSSPSGPRAAGPRRPRRRACPAHRPALASASAASAAVARRPPRPRAPRPRGDVGRQARRRSASAEPLVERAELEEVEELAHLVGVEPPRRPGRRGRRRGRRRARSTITSAFGAHLRLVLGQVLAQLGRLLVDVGEDAVEAAVGVDQLGRRLLAHPGHAGQVVGRVAPQRGVLDVVDGAHTGALDDAGLVVEGVVGHAPRL